MGNGMRGMQGTRGMFTRIPGNLLEDSGESSSSELNYCFSYLITSSFLFLSFLCWGKGVITVRRDRGIKKLQIILNVGVNRTSKKAASQGNTYVGVLF